MPENGSKNIITSRSNWATWLPVAALVMANLSGGAQTSDQAAAQLTDGANLLEQLFAWGSVFAATLLQIWHNVSPSGKTVTLGKASPAVLLLACFGLAALARPAFAFTLDGSPELLAWNLARAFGVALIFGAFVWLARRQRGAA